MEKQSVCCGCGQELFEDAWACAACRQRFPPSLLKACGDAFDYALGLRDGTVIRFQTACIQGEWVELRADGVGVALADWPDGYKQRQLLPGGFCFGRGIDIRLSEIVWCADAPEGS